MSKVKFTHAVVIRYMDGDGWAYSGTYYLTNEREDGCRHVWCENGFKDLTGRDPDTWAESWCDDLERFEIEELSR